MIQAPRFDTKQPLNKVRVKTVRTAMKRVLDSCVKGVINGSGHGDGTRSLICVNEHSTASPAKSQPSDGTDGQQILEADDDSTATRRKKPRLGSTNEVVPPSSESSSSQGSEDISEAAKDVESERHPPAMVHLSVIHGPSDSSLAHVPAEEQFPYERLDTSKLEIRVITLHPGSQTDHIRCSLTHIATNKGSKPIYKALSYTWGSPESPKTIILNGVRVQVRENLWQALYHLRSDDQELTIWIDALCINQNDLQERSSQVSRMSAIYGLAEEVVVWLGPAGDGSELAMDFLQRKFYPHKGPRIKDMPLTELLRESSGAEIQATASLMAREYWHRVWIIQEIFRARLVTLHCGRDTLKWPTLSRFFRYLTRQPEREESLQQRIVDVLLDCCNTPAKDLTRHRTSQNHCLEDLLTAYKSCHSSDPRDKVYALIGLSQRKVRPDSIPIKNGDDWILVDYSKSTLELFQYLVHLYETASVRIYSNPKGIIAWMQLLQEVLDLTDNIHSNQTMKRISALDAEMEPITGNGFYVLHTKHRKPNVNYAASSPPWFPLAQEYMHILEWLKSIEWFDQSEHARCRLVQILDHFSHHDRERVKKFGCSGDDMSPSPSAHISVLNGGACFILTPVPLEDDYDVACFHASDIALIVKEDVIMGRAVLYNMNGPVRRVHFSAGKYGVEFSAPFNSSVTNPRFYLPVMQTTLSIQDWARVVALGKCPISGQHTPVVVGTRDSARTLNVPKLGADSKLEGHFVHTNVS